jgi:hypothetical protein
VRAVLTDHVIRECNLPAGRAAAFVDDLFSGQRIRQKTVVRKILGLIAPK